MNTTQLKRFATEARTKLREGVLTRLMRLGFDTKTGSVRNGYEPEELPDGGLWNNQHVSLSFLYNWKQLHNHIKEQGIKQVVEEGAYIWFNRLVAIRILAKNGLCEPVLEFVDSARTPMIVDEARQGRIPPMSQQDREYLEKLFEDDRLVDEQFALIINVWIKNNPIISKCFDSHSISFMELLLPDGIRREGGFLDMLNNVDFITNEDYASPELIGWLYQFYNSERKDEVFAKKGKYEANEIAPATQIFTPNWIVKYMVQNTVGRIYLDANPSAKRLAENWKYLVKPADSEEEQTPLKYGELEDLKVADLACGSGHILNECFDLLYELYVFEGYSRREAITNIFTHNLTGIDIDLRAKQLATFALLLKACQRDQSFADAHCMPKVYSMPKVDELTYLNMHEQFDEVYKLQEYFHIDLQGAFNLMKDADTLGSIMKFDISSNTREYLEKAVSAYHKDPKYANAFESLIVGYEIILALTQKYDAIVMNPPYMGSGSMNEILSEYVKKYYPMGKTDLFSVFMEVCLNSIKSLGKLGMINLPSWLFLSSFESLRLNIITRYHIDSLLHMGRGIFGIDWGSTAFVITKQNIQTRGIYLRLHERNFQHIYYNHIGQLFLLTKNNPSFKFDFGSYRDEDVTTVERYDFVSNDNGTKIFYEVSQSDFLRIPNTPIAYWVSKNLLSSFKGTLLKDLAVAVKGLDTCDNDTFVRNWFEVKFESIGLRINNTTDTYSHKWFPYCKGGYFRKWYGLYDKIVNWQDDGKILRNLRNEEGKIKSRPQNVRYYFKSGIAFNSLTAVMPSMRYMCNAIFGGGGSGMFSKYDVTNLLGFLNSKVTRYILNILNPTINILVGDIMSLPIKFDDKDKSINSIVRENIEMSKLGWDAHETSWDFKENEIIGLNSQEKFQAMLEELSLDSHSFKPSDVDFNSLEWRTKQIKEKWSRQFNRLHKNEEELNRRFIEIYGLQDELTPDVPLDEVTILQDGEISIWKEGDPVPVSKKNGLTELSSLIWHDDVLMKQLLSYAIGCMMGRYRLDKPGLAIAHPNPTREEIAPYEFNGEMFNIDDDAIIPLMPTNSGFEDNAVVRMSDFVRQVFGEANQTINLNYIEKCLGKTIEQYFIKDFWKDHKKMYQNRPIYWLFSSKKGAFQVITYMHRMTPYTLERIRSKYLLPYIDTLNARIKNFETREMELSTKERREMEYLRKLVEECEEYQERLAVVAEQAIGFDLDDGVINNYALYGDVLAKLK